MEVEGTLDISKIAIDVRSPIPETKLEAVRKLRQFLSCHQPPIDQVIESGVLPELVSFLGNDDDPTLQFEAAWLLTNVASGTSEQTRALVEAKAIPGFVHLLSSRNNDLREQGVWALGNIAGDCPELRDQVLEGGALKYLLHSLITSSQLTLVKHALWTVSNLCRGKPAPSFSMVSPAIPILELFLSAPEEEMLFGEDLLGDVLWSLAFLSDGSDDQIEMLVNNHDLIIPRLVDLMGSEHVAVTTPSLRSIANILTSDNHTQTVLDCPMALPNLKKLFNATDKRTRKEACWAFSNITAGKVSEIQRVIDDGVVSMLIDFVGSNDLEMDLKQEGVVALGNIFTGASVEQVVALEHIVIPVFVSLLDCCDLKVILICLESLDNILRVGEDPIRFGERNPFVDTVEKSGGIEKLEELQAHQSQRVYERAFMILEQYFSDEEDEE